MDRAVHKRYLVYRDLHGYFGGRKAALAAADFEKADAEYEALRAKGDAREDEEEVRLAELAKLLHRD